ncbi:amidohydrolase [Clostridium gasigenes]|uniref:M20 metallopeptidase family protein n=1 Tax=Clostridium gasigenes TaxID=94869 RepID=UPI001C0C8BE2|nr:M20 family metallopeptidase [Clostridium gasigenes]MBU3136728.1 amidohydrolase [Clostridium gasigenes]
MINFKEEANTIKEELIIIRRELHKYPEIGMEEFKTQELIKTFLKDEGIPFIEVAKTGVCGIIKGEKPGPIKTIALRSDIDGLPMDDKKTCDYSSKINGRMHACGHDAHIAILLGVAKILNKNKNFFSGNVKLFFEPAEETVGGSRFMIEEGVLENPSVDVICGLHVEETIECGKIMVKSGVVNASSNPFKIKIKGSGGHGAYPHTTVDPIVIASSVVIAIQNIISREVNAANSAVITIASIHGGQAQNVIPEEVNIKGIIRTLIKEDREFIKNRLVEVVEGVCKYSRGTCEIEIEDSYPSLYNDDNMVSILKRSAETIIGNENILNQENIKMGVESFAYFAEQRPSVFYFLGTGNNEKHTSYPAHSSLFDIDEDAIAVGIAIQCQLVSNYLTIT